MSALPFRVSKAFTRAALVRRSRSSMTRCVPCPRTRTETLTLSLASGAFPVLLVSVAVVAVVVVLVDSVVEFVPPPGVVVVVVVVVVVLMGRVGSVTVGRVTDGTVVVTQPMTGKQSSGAAGTELENAPAARSPVANTAAPASTRPRGPNRVQLCRRDRRRFMGSRC